MRHGEAMRPYVYVKCPACETRIREPFSRYSGPVVNAHRVQSNGRWIMCRAIVTPDPTGHDHHVHPVPRHVRTEDALVRALDALPKAA